ncbi:MBL fold metallo-hydrolase [Sinomonas sp. JGH33]|uniref:MBL fold metallo-hydrolase n=1 Tax=Sinomonas terricola TaxID=3110330 RepID=A0ABU5T912_9MICC|nr:MBL fold metallo-hydrolase [Sinomonas sp. JGH33]MEA5456068.1 MBL fold metallo-hydrolase [Sinomonas sp. JGH33]
MRLTKYTHACVRLDKPAPVAGGGAPEDGGARRVLVIDPGSFSEVEEALRGAEALLVTHEHADHVDVDRVAAVLGQSPVLEAWAPARVAEQLRAAAPGAADRIHAAEPNTEFEAAGYRVQTFGSQHALIHPLVPVVANIGYLVDGEVFHPGDSFTVPHGTEVGTLLVPIHAPWNKIGEVVDFIIAVRARRAYPIHNALLNDRGTGLVEGHARRIGDIYGTAFAHLEPGESVEL